MHSQHTRTRTRTHAHTHAHAVERENTHAHMVHESTRTRTQCLCPPCRKFSCFYGSPNAIWNQKTRKSSTPPPIGNGFWCKNIHRADKCHFWTQSSFLDTVLIFGHAHILYADPVIIHQMSVYCNRNCNRNES